MKKKIITTLIILTIVILAIFTGTWIFDVSSYVFRFGEKVFGLIASALQWLAKLFNWFSWNKGIL